MGNVKKPYIDNRDMLITLAIPISVIAKLIEHLFLPDKYFYDSNRMLGMVLGDKNTYAWGGNYEITADIFRSINIFDFTSLLQWSILIGIIFDILLLISFIRLKGLDMLQSIFAFMCVGLCNIYVFNLGKDIIQFAFFALCFVIISIDRIPTWLKVIGCAAVFYWESTFFRNYYIIMSAFTIGVYAILKVVRQKKIKVNIKKIILIVGILFVLMYMFLNVARVFMPEEYDDILTCKAGTEVMTATTMINDQIDFDTNINLYMLNYIINSVRMLFPIELLTGGVFYIPFLAFQILLFLYTYKNIRNIHKISEKNVVALCVFIAFFMGSVLFEPDFGSFARHEAAAFPIIILFALDNLNIIGKEESNQEERVVVYE
ncbi:MAG: hypothetical protein ACLRZ9_11250 [Eubacterium sp.]